MDKTLRFKEGIQNWINNDYNGLFDYATGVGKTSVGILCCEYYIRNVKPTAAVTIITPNDIIAKQWKNRIQEMLPKKLAINFNFFSINYIIANDFNIVTDILVLDEVHEYGSPKAFEVIDSKIKYDKYICLTASTDDKKFHKFKNFEVIDTITEEDAINLGFIADFIEYNLQVEFIEKEQIMYDKYTKKIDEYKVYFEIANLHYLVLCNLVISGGNDKNGKYFTAEQWCKSVAKKHGYNQNSSNDGQVSPASIRGMAFVITKSIRSRLQVLKEVYGKQIATIKLLQKFPDKKAIVFSESTEVCDKVYTMAVNIGIKATIFHSKIKPRMLPGKRGQLIKFGAVRLKKKAIEDMESGEATVLFTGSSFDKGYNEESLKLSITLSGTRDNTKYKQRGGRAKRVKGDSTALLVNMYVKGTVDEDSLVSRQRNVTHTIIETDSIDSINYKSKSNSKFNLDDFQNL